MQWRHHGDRRTPLPRISLAALDHDNAKGEFYLTDIVRIARRRGLACGVVELPVEDLPGINTRADLAAAEALMQHRLRRAAMEEGASLDGAGDGLLSAPTPGSGAMSWSSRMSSSAPASRSATACAIRSFCHIEGAVVGAGRIVGPFARLRPGAVLEAEVHVGNFVEIKEARLGTGAKASHLSYLGDSDIGARRQYRRRHHHLQL